MKQLTQEIFDKIKAQPQKTRQEMADKYGVSKTTVTRIRSSVTLEEAKSKGAHRKNDDSAKKTVKKNKKLTQKQKQYVKKTYKVYDETHSGRCMFSSSGEEVSERCDEEGKIVSGTGKLYTISTPKRNMFNRLFDRIFRRNK